MLLPLGARRRAPHLWGAAHSLGEDLSWLSPLPPWRRAAQPTPSFLSVPTGAPQHQTLALQAEMSPRGAGPRCWGGFTAHLHRGLEPPSHCQPLWVPGPRGHDSEGTAAQPVLSLGLGPPWGHHAAPSGQGRQAVSRLSAGCQRAHCPILANFCSIKQSQPALPRLCVKGGWGQDRTGSPRAALPTLGLPRALPPFCLSTPTARGRRHFVCPHR